MSVFYFVDVETSGLSPTKNTILEFCCIKHVNRKEVDRLYMKIHPTDQDMLFADAKALEINSYSKAKWEEAFLPEEAARRISSFVYGTKESAFIAHNAKFDFAFVREFLKRHGAKNNLPYRVIDTVSIAFAALQPLGLKSMKLDEIRKFFNWSLENNHTAMKDCEDLVALYDLLSPIPHGSNSVIMNQIIVNKTILSR